MATIGGGSTGRGLSALLVYGLAQRGGADVGGGQCFTLDQRALGRLLGLHRRRLCQLIARGRACGVLYTTRPLDPATGWLGVNTYHVRSLEEYLAWVKERRGHHPRSDHVHDGAPVPVLHPDIEALLDLRWHDQTEGPPPDRGGGPVPSPYQVPGPGHPATTAAMEAARDQLRRGRDRR